MDYKRILYLLIALAFSIESNAVERNGYIYTITKDPGAVVMNQTAVMTGRTAERYNESVWYCSTSSWVDNGLLTNLKGLSVNGNYGRCDYLYATGVNLTDIYQFEVSGITNVYLGSEDDRPVSCRISENAFKNSSKSITHLQLNKGIISIGNNAFASMKAGKIICKGTPPLLYGEPFNDTAYENVFVIVENNQLSNYKSSSWNKFKRLMSDSQYCFVLSFTRGCPQMVNVGESITLTANTSNSNLIWKSSNKEIATVENGVVFGHKVGKTTISATYINGSVATMEVEVIQPVTDLHILVNEQHVENSILPLKIDQTLQLSAQILPENATYKTVEWSTNDSTVATVDESGLVTPVGVGETVVTCKATDNSNITTSCKIKVTPIYISSISIPESWEAEVGEILNINAIVLPENATNKTIRWSSSNTFIADVDDNGNVTAKGVGECIVKARTTDGSDLESTCKVTVLPTAIESLSLNETIVNRKVGESFSIEATILPDNATVKTLNWSSSDENIATVDSWGEVTIYNVGECEIHAHTTDGSDIDAVCRVTGTLDAGEVVIDGLLYVYDNLTKTAILTKCVNPDSEVVIPESITAEGQTYSVTSIGNHAFYGCSRLRSLKIPTSVSQIGYVIFDPFSSINIAIHIYDIESWCNIDFDPNSDILNYGDLYLGDELISDLEIPNGTKLINDYAFENCRSINSLAIPNSVTSIGKSAFNNCRNLNTVYIGNGVEKICDNAFTQCYSLTSVKIPNSVNSIGDYAYYGCKKVTSLTIGNSVTEIGTHAFTGCIEMKKVTFSDSDKTLCFKDTKSTFYDCPIETLYLGRYIPCDESTSLFGTKIKSLIIGNSVTSIGSSAFNNCTGLKEVTIGNSVTSIGNFAFEECSSVVKLVSKNTTPPNVGPYSLLGLSESTCELIVPKGSLETYKSAMYWKDFLHIRESDEASASVDDIESDSNEIYNVYNLQGISIMTGASKDDLEALAPGIYIINGKKVLIK